MNTQPNEPANMPAASQALAVLPSSDDLSTWVDLLGRVGGGLVKQGAALPEVGTPAAAALALQLQMLRLWLVGALHIRVAADSGEPVSEPDPMQLPIGQPPQCLNSVAAERGRIVEALQAAGADGVPAGELARLAMVGNVEARVSELCKLGHPITSAPGTQDSAEGSTDCGSVYRLAAAGGGASGASPTH